MTRWQWFVRLLSRRMWFRAALFCAFGGVLALAGALAGHFISYEVANSVGASSVDNILNIVASSMLAVTTFSLTAMVSAYSGATSTITPRAVQLLIEDSTAQNALATFLGSFLFAIVGIIALSTGIYGETGRVILFAGTILVILFIVITLLRWIEHISRFGRVADTIDRVERAAVAAIAHVVLPLDTTPNPPRDADDRLADICPDILARITHVDVQRLGLIAQEIDADIGVLALPGTLADPDQPIARVAGSCDEGVRKRIREAFTLAHHRAFDHDPRFGLIVLSEIASRALSPAVNDPGTAIAVIEAGSRVVRCFADHTPDEDDELPPRVRLPAVRLEDVLEDLFRPIARDGAAMIEVGIRLQKALASLARHSPVCRPLVMRVASDALDRAKDALASDADRTTLERVHHELFG